MSKDALREAAWLAVSALERTHHATEVDRSKAADALRAALAEAPQDVIERCQCGYPLPCAKTVPVEFCRLILRNNT